MKWRYGDISLCTGELQADMIASGYDLADMDALRYEPSAMRTQKTLHENGMWVLTLCGAHPSWQTGSSDYGVRKMGYIS